MAQGVPQKIQEGIQNMKLVYDINDRPPLKQNLIYALQQLLAIMAASVLIFGQYGFGYDGTSFIYNQF